jgi:hypothetical protein
MDMEYIIKEIEGLYRVIALKEFRHTPGVTFDVLAKSMVPKVDAIDRVLHEGPAISPGPIGEVDKPWYMHPSQADNLFVLAGVRYIEVYNQLHGKVESFEVAPQYLKHNGEMLFDGPALLVWPRGVFHRIVSGKDGSASINLATHYEGFDIRNNFNIYDLDTETGEYRLIREGYKDQE